MGQLVQEPSEAQVAQGRLQGEQASEVVREKFAAHVLQVIASGQASQLAMQGRQFVPDKK